MTPARLILVGGFLGAGKTTLLAQAGQRLTAEGHRVGLVTNDQAPGLVDSGVLRTTGADVGEVAGGCFCCRFDTLLTVTRDLFAQHAPDIIIGEPVGSCTDLSATVLQPMKAYHRDLFTTAPFSVLVDPDRLREALEPRLASPHPASVRYIMRKQLEEADIIVLNKVDTLQAEDRAELTAAASERYPQAQIMAISALTGAGVDTWLAAVLAGAPGGRRIVEVDYDLYAEGEAVLGWLNADVKVTTRPATAGVPYTDAGDTDWRLFALNILERTAETCRAQGGEIAHLKVLVSAEGGDIVANLTSNAGTPAARGAITGAPTAAQLTVNARVALGPEALEAIVRAAIAEVAGAALCAEITHLESFRPGRPQPTHRFTETVAAE
jgi:Ni2+-binding GTPase involved in maturation of urease and hydrogenase